MPSLVHQRCYNHAVREAVGQCLGCRHYFCRECLIEHEDRLTCANCLRDKVKPPITRRPLFLGLVRLTQILVGVMILWSAFYLVGRGLLAIPAAFHEGTLWQEPWFDE